MTDHTPRPFGQLDPFAKEAVEAIFADLRGRGFLKWLFDERGADNLIGRFDDGQEIRAIDLDAQAEIARTWREIISKAYGPSNKPDLVAVECGGSAPPVYVSAPTQQLDDAIEAFWNVAYQQGLERRIHDDKEGSAQRAEDNLRRAIAAPPQLDPAEFQLLERLDRDNVAGGARPVIESQGWDQARRLSERGLIAIEQVGLGGRLHITVKGMRAVRAFMEGKSNATG